MTEQIISDTPRLRTIEYSSRICLGVRFGIEMIHETHRIFYVPFDDLGKLRPDRGYYAESSGGKWTLSDDRYELKLSFPDRSAMTKWVKKHIKGAA